MNDRQRKDRLIQTRVPQDLESTLKDEARKRRLSVSHLIRNVLEDTFNLVDNVVVEVDRVVTDSVEMAKTFQRDAQRLAATARGETSHRQSTSPPAETVERDSEAPENAPEDSEPNAAAEPPSAGDEGLISAPETSAPSAEALEILSHVYAWQELVVHKPTRCLRCEKLIGRGEHAFLAQSDQSGAPRVWICQPCLDQMGDNP